jgi:hypothetical protein
MSCMHGYMEENKYKYIYKKARFNKYKSRQGGISFIFYRDNIRARQIFIFELLTS